MLKIVNNAFKNPKSSLYHKVNNFYALLTIVSIVSLVLETVESLGAYTKIFTFIEWGAVILFLFEYIGRSLVTTPARKYWFSFFGIVDLVAILPTFFGLGNFVFLKSARALRIIRLLRMLRLAKIGRSGIVDDQNMSMVSLNILIYFSVLTFALLITGTAMFLIEGNQSTFASIPAGMWWALKVFLGGINVAQPVTALGEVFLVLTRFVGLLLLGLLIGIVGNVFKGLLLAKK